MITDIKNNNDDNDDDDDDDDDNDDDDDDQWNRMIVFRNGYRLVIPRCSQPAAEN